MANSTTRTARAILKPLHTWIGVAAGLFLSVIAATGSLILFRAELERAAYPQGALSSGAPHRVSVDQAASEIVQARPGWHIRRVRLPQAPGDPYVVQVESDDKPTERIVADAATGRVLGTVETGTVDWLVDLHRNLLAGKQGRKAVGIFGIVLFVLSISGMSMWLTSRRNWRAWITPPRPGSRRRFHFELHRLAGLWACVFLAAISFTGIGLAFPDSFRQAVQDLTGKPTDVRGPRKVSAKLMRPLDDYLRSGRAAMADGVAIELRLPAGKGPVDLHLYRRGDLAPSGNHVYLDPATAKVLQVDRIVDRPIGARFLAALSPIHYGEFGGLPVKIAWALFGLTPLLLLLTGLAAWWGPSQRKVTQAAEEKTGNADFVTADL
jgi:uncharacterized iron-regulated membrane protein